MLVELVKWAKNPIVLSVAVFTNFDWPTSYGGVSKLVSQSTDLARTGSRSLLMAMKS